MKEKALFGLTFLFLALAAVGDLGLSLVKKILWFGRKTA